MATAVFHAVAVTSGSVLNPQNALGPVNGVFTTDTGNINWTGRWVMDGIAGQHALVGPQQFAVQLRNQAPGGTFPTVNSVQLFQNKVPIGGSRFNSIVSTSGAGIAVEFTVAASELSGSADIEIEVVTTGSGGKPASRRAVQVDALTWIAEYVATFGTPMKVYQGGQWVQGYLKYFNGTTWVEKPARVHQDGQWVTT